MERKPEMCVEVDVSWVLKVVLYECNTLIDRYKGAIKM